MLPKQYYEAEIGIHNEPILNYSEKLRHNLSIKLIGPEIKKSKLLLLIMFFTKKLLTKSRTYKL